jgi:hypothetical protein
VDILYIKELDILTFLVKNSGNKSVNGLSAFETEESDTLDLYAVRTKLRGKFQQHESNVSGDLHYVRSVDSNLPSTDRFTIFKLSSTKLGDTSPLFSAKGANVQLQKGKYLRHAAHEGGKTNLYVNHVSFLKILFDLRVNPMQSQDIQFARCEKLFQFDNSKIEDFRIVPNPRRTEENSSSLGFSQDVYSNNDYVLTACDNMNLYYHNIDEALGVRLICKTDIGIEISERITAISVNPSGLLWPLS